MSVCILAACKITVLAFAAFTLSWTHSVERTRLEEDWRVTSAGFQIVKARIQGSGVEPPEGSRLQQGWWVYRPTSTHCRASCSLHWERQARGGHCDKDSCMVFGAAADDPMVLQKCETRPNKTSDCKHGPPHANDRQASAARKAAMPATGQRPQSSPTARQPRSPYTNTMPDLWLRPDGTVSVPSGTPPVILGAQENAENTGSNATTVVEVRPL
ncbi:DUF1850 domain-containing protein [Mesorhizobium sp.]|uniref:DUF1850 domain-containing protein n=1 Tax=Mesorhizobium sp. TaxID=1871066 RepID=UPI003457832C